MAVLNIPEDWRTISVSAYPGFPQISAFRHESRRKAETGESQIRTVASRSGKRSKES